MNRFEFDTMLAMAAMAVLETVPTGPHVSRVSTTHWLHTAPSMTTWPKAAGIRSCNTGMEDLALPRDEQQLNGDGSAAVAVDVRHSISCALATDFNLDRR